MVSYAVFNLLIGYLLHHRTEGQRVNLLLYVVAMGLHFFINDHWMHHNHLHRYHRVGRWVLAAASLLGWIIGMVTHFDEPVVLLIFAFLAGSVIMNVLKEELPLDREHNYWPFVLAAVAYSTILLVLE